MDNYKVLYLTEDVDDQAILKILTLNNTLDLDTATLSYYKKLATWANERKAKIKNVNLDTIELSDRSLIGKGISARTNSLLSTLNELNGKLAKKFDVNNEISKKVQQMTVEILAGLSKIKNPIQTKKQEPNKQEPEEQETTDRVSEEQALYPGMDWTAEKARRLKNANGKATSKILDKFYNDYYKIEYAGLKTPEENDTTGIVDKLKGLDKILIQEFNKLGYNPAVNPLAQFLKNLIKYKPDIFKKLNTNNYGAIHNSFIDKYITGNTLGNYNENHILFCEDLYNYKGLDIVKYLKLYKDTLDKAKSAEVEPPQDMWTLAVKIFIIQDLSSPDAPSKIQFKDKVTALIQKQDGLKTPVANNAKLRSLAEIEELYTYIFKAAPDTEKQEENETLKLIVDYAKKKDIILDMLYDISQRDTFRRAYPKDASTVEQQLTELDYKLDGRGIKIKESKKVLDLDEEQLTAEDLRTIVKKLFAAYKTHNKRTAK